jgi:hypothetical protein
MAGGDCIDDAVRHEALIDRVGWKDPPSACRSRSSEAGGSLILGTQGRVGAAPTTTGRAGTVRRFGSGKRDEKVYERNQCRRPLSDAPTPNLTDMGREAAHACWWATPKPIGVSSVGRPRRRSAAYPWRCCRGTAGRLPRRPVVSERGNHSGAALRPATLAGGGQVRGRLLGPGWGGALVVVGGRESRSQGEGGQRVRSGWPGMSGGRR